MSYLGVGPGNLPVYHGTNLKVTDRRVRLAELVLRCVICCLGVLAAVLVGTDTQVKEIFSIEKKARFTDMKALVFLVAANGIAAAYSLVQGVRCVVGMVKGSVLFSKPLAWVIFSGDQSIYNQSKTIEPANLPCEGGYLSTGYNGELCMRVTGIYEYLWFQMMAYLTMSAVATAAQSAAFAKLGQPDLQWMKICTMYGTFCNRVGEGIASALLVSVSMVVLSCISAFSLFRLYGGNKGKDGARW